jgi:uncharacterized membrane protein YdjX (TVP38/TMEM64 family)
VTWARRWLPVLGAASVAFLAAVLLPIAEWLRQLQAWIGSLGTAAPIVYAFIYVLAALAFVPGSVLTVGAGLLFGFWRAFLIVWLSATIAAALAFLIARHWARPAVARWAAKNERFQAIDRAIEKKGALVVLLLRLSPLVPFSLSNYLYGLTAVSFRSYVLASGLGMLPGTALYVYLGSVGRAVGEKRTLAEWVLLFAGLAATAVVTILISRAAKKELDKTAVPAS